MRLLLATGNRHKVEELARLLPGVELAPLPESVELPPETGETFDENALGKAAAAHEATGEPAIADDSGIEAAALDGRPGVRSARFAGPDAGDAENLALLLEEVGSAGGDRRAAYVCSIALVGHGPEPVFFHGRCSGVLIESPRGAGGFGYDPAFVPDATGPGDERTMAELSPDEKHAISHRAIAARQLAAHLSA